MDKARSSLDVVKGLVQRARRISYIRLYTKVIHLMDIHEFDEIMDKIIRSHEVDYLGDEKHNYMLVWRGKLS